MRCRRREPMPEEVRRAADLLERRWTLSILYASVEGAVRFNEFVAVLGRVPPATLTARLTELAEAGLLERRVLDTRPPAVEYLLTARGKRFEPLLRELVRVLQGLRLKRDAAGEHVGALLEAVHLDEVVRPERGRAPLVRAAGAEEMSELEHERDQVDRDQERKEELDVLPHSRAGLLDAL